MDTLVRPAYDVERAETPCAVASGSNGPGCCYPRRTGVIVMVLVGLCEEAITVIRMRPASRNERKLYADRQEEKPYRAR